MRSRDNRRCGHTGNFEVFAAKEKWQIRVIVEGNMGLKGHMCTYKDRRVYTMFLC